MRGAAPGPSSARRKCATTPGKAVFCALLFASALTLVGVRQASAQNSLITGVVVDAETGDLLPAVHVFLSESMIGAVSDSNGVYELDHVPPGAYELVALMVGFTGHSERIEVMPSVSTYEIDLSISPAIVEMEEVEVVAETPRAWRRHLRRFEELFIGTGPNARDTRIVNQHMLDFEERDGIFFASASAPLEVINRALGYEITFVLTDFRMDMAAGLLFMHGPFRFRELNSDDQREVKRWERNRERTYRGSLQHVLASLVRHQTVAQGIFIKWDDRKDAPFSREEPFLKSIDGLAFVKATERPYLYTLRFPAYLFVTYRDDRSWLTLNRGAASVHESGYVYAPEGAPGSITVYGSLAARRVADLLPREYRWMQPSEWPFSRSPIHR